MQFVFLDEGSALTMPVTPSSYRWGAGSRMETLNLSQLGDVFRPGGRRGMTGRFSFLLPAQAYPFLEPGTRADPQYYIDQLTVWATGKKPVRMIITGTAVNVPVYIEAVDYGEKDGTRDVYAEVSVREFVELSAQERQEAAGGGLSRPGSQSQARGGTLYTIRYGDTLSAICRRFYGRSDPRCYNALAKVNGIPNPHLIHPGHSIRIPSLTELMGGAA